MRNILHHAKLLSTSVISIIVLVIFYQLTFANDSTSVSKANLDEGPYVFWDNDTLAVVLYYCDETIVKHRIVFTDTLHFEGLCHDTEVQYSVIAGDYNIQPAVFTGVSKLFAISDIHGDYEHMVNILQNGGVIDDDLRWKWGDGHLVVNGDIFDRGDMVTECLWLTYHLEQEAIEHGGMVHTLLGNHEMMVLRGDDRYIHEKYLKGIARKSRIKHMDLYGPDMALGQWLRSKQVVIRINDILFVHAGISPMVIDSGLTLDDLNRTVRSGIDMLSSRLAFTEQVKFLLSSLGPLWYRGYHYEMENRYPQATADDVDRILAHFDAATVVVGHTEVDSLIGLYDNRVIAIDIPVDELGSLQALLWKDGRFYRVSGDGKLAELR
ncbi:MAG: metallophosphoesterase [candidate division Zixibacteria bacterium]|nr:metallophosphoesterase [candidate division Zixibacteria bacterium]